MATRAKKSRGKSGAKTAKRSGSSARRGPALKKKSAKKKKASAKRAAAKKAKKAAPKRASAKKAVVKRPAAKKPSRNPITRVTRVAKEVAQQASTAVSEGVETLKELGESLVDRVTG
jgi:hypothetical protein